MTEGYRNITVQIGAAAATDDVLIYTPETGKNGLLSILRASINVTQYRIGTTPYIASIKLQTPTSTDPITVRQLAIAPQTVLGAYLDLILQFSPSVGFGFESGSALFMSLNDTLQGSDNITIFGVAAEA